MILSVGSYKLGALTTEFEYEELAAKYREDEARMLIEIEDKQAEIEKLKGRGVRTVYVEKDPTGCSDTRVPDGVLALLRETAGQPSPND